MSVTAEVTYVCEICGKEIDDKRGAPRWCSEHCEAGRRQDKRHRQARYEGWKRRPPRPRLECYGCATTLLTPAESGLCGFCEVERGLRDAV